MFCRRLLLAIQYFQSQSCNARKVHRGPAGKTKGEELQSRTIFGDVFDLIWKFFDFWEFFLDFLEVFKFLEVFRLFASVFFGMLRKICFLWQLCFQVSSGLGVLLPDFDSTWDRPAAFFACCRTKAVLMLCGYTSNSGKLKGLHRQAWQKRDLARDGKASACQILGDEMNPKRVYGSYTLLGIIVLRVYDPNFRVHFVPKDGDQEQAPGFADEQVFGTYLSLAMVYRGPCQPWERNEP